MLSSGAQHFSIHYSRGLNRTGCSSAGRGGRWDVEEDHIFLTFHHCALHATWKTKSWTKHLGERPSTSITWGCERNQEAATLQRDICCFLCHTFSAQFENICVW